jgi:hypothetical protein
MLPNTQAYPVAARTVQGNSHVADLARAAERPMIDAPIDDDPAADARTQANIEKVPKALARAITVLADSRRVRVIFDGAPHAKLTGENIAQWDPLPAGQVRRCYNHAVLDVQRSGHTDPNRVCRTALCLEPARSTPGNHRLVPLWLDRRVMCATTSPSTVTAATNVRAAEVDA